MNTFYLKQYEDSFKVVNANKCSFREVSEIRCLVEQLDDKHVEVFEPTTGLVLFKGLKIDMKDHLREKSKDLKVYMTTNAAEIQKKKLNAFVFEHIDEIYERMYKR